MSVPISASQKIAIAKVSFRRNSGRSSSQRRRQMPMIFTDGQDVENAIIFVNDAILELTGFTRAALLGRPLSHLLRRNVERRR